MNKKEKGWIGVDLDGTLAEYNGWVGPLSIGPPIEKMVKLVRNLIAAGKTVKIFTARIDEPRNWDIQDAIERWCKTHIGTTLEITNIKDKYCTKIYDDRAIGVKPNTGDLLEYTQEDFDNNYWEGLMDSKKQYEEGYEEGYAEGYEDAKGRF